MRNHQQIPEAPNNLMSVGFDEYFQAVAGLVRPGGMQPKAE